MIIAKGPRGGGHTHTTSHILRAGREAKNRTGGKLLGRERERGGGDDIARCRYILSTLSFPALHNVVVIVVVLFGVRWCT